MCTSVVISSVFAKLQPRRPFTPLVPSLEGSLEGPLFRSNEKAPIEDPHLVGTVSESSSPLPTLAQIRPSRHTLTSNQNQLLLRSSKTRPSKYPPNPTALNFF